MHTDSDRQAGVDQSGRPHTSSKHDFLFVGEGGGGGQQYVPTPINHQLAARHQALLALLPIPVCVPPQTMSYWIFRRSMAIV